MYCKLKQHKESKHLKMDFTKFKENVFMEELL